MLAKTPVSEKIEIIDLSIEDEDNGENAGRENKSIQQIKKNLTGAKHSDSFQNVANLPIHIITPIEQSKTQIKVCFSLFSF